MPQAAIDKHLSVIGNPQAMEAALAWYRACGERQPIGPTKVLTLFVWGDADETVGRISVEGTPRSSPPIITSRHCQASEPAADQVPAQVNALLLEHLGRHPA